MARSLQDLLREAAQLSENDRAELAGRLIQTLEAPADADVESAWSEEIERRIRDIDEGKIKTIRWEEVRAELLSRSRARG